MKFKKTFALAVLGVLSTFAIQAANAAEFPLPCRVECGRDAMGTLIRPDFSGERELTGCIESSCAVIMYTLDAETNPKRLAYVDSYGIACTGRYEASDKLGIAKNEGFCR